MNQVKESIQSNTNLVDIEVQLLRDRLDLRSAIQRGNETQARLFAKRIVWWTRRKAELKNTVQSP